MDRTEQLKNLVENCRDLILKTERDIWASPETGYHEWKTNAYMEKLFEDLGYTLTKAGEFPASYRCGNRKAGSQGSDPGRTGFPDLRKPPGRCPYADERCAAEVPEFKEVSSGHWAACHHLDKVK